MNTITTYKFSTLADALSAARAAAEIMIEEARRRGVNGVSVNPDEYITGSHGGDSLAAETYGYTVDPSEALRLQFEVGTPEPTPKTAGPLIWDGEEGTCPKCGGDLELDEEESDGEGIGRAAWTCPDCGATGVQIREAVFQYHRDVETPEDSENKAKAALYPAPRTEYSPSGIMAFTAIGAGSGKWGPQINREEAERLLAPEDGEDSDDYGFTIYCKEASDRPGLWAGIESGDLEDGKLPEDWETFEIMFSPAPHEFER